MWGPGTRGTDVTMTDRSKRVALRMRTTALVSVAFIFASVVACSGDDTPQATPTAESTATVAAASATPSSTPIPTETPKSIPTSVGTPNAATPAIAAAAGKAYFPPPPPRASAPPANSAGIARVVATNLGVDHYVEVDHIVNNEMESPRDGEYAIGFYPDFDKPGAGGNSVFSAHETWNHFQGPFYQLANAKVGDEITIVMSDGRNFRYRVFSNVRYEVDSMPMAEVLWPTKRPKGEEWLTMFTCGGRIVYGSNGFGEYLDRDVIIAKRIP